MDYYASTDTAITQELGQRLKALRLRQNVSQQELAVKTQLSLVAIKAAEKGKAKLSTLVAILRVLSALDEIDRFIQPVTISPLQLAKTGGKQRKRAARK